MNVLVNKTDCNQLDNATIDVTISGTTADIGCQKHSQLQDILL
jgi:hypothetical protein